MCARGRPLNFTVRRHMVAAFLPLLCLALAAFAAWNTIACARMGVLTARGGVQISRSENPILIWLGISIGGYRLSSSALPRFYGLQVSCGSMVQGDA